MTTFLIAGIPLGIAVGSMTSVAAIEEGDCALGAVMKGLASLLICTFAWPLALLYITARGVWEVAHKGE